MKRYTMIFVSVILALVTLLIPNQRVKAATIYELNYEDVIFSEEYQTQYNQVIEYLKSIEDTHYVFFGGQPNTNFSINVVKKTATNYTSYYQISGGINFGGSSNSEKVYYNFLRHIELSNFASQFKTLKNRIASDTYHYAAQSFIFQSSLTHENNVMTNNNLMVYYSNIDVNYKGNNLMLNGTNLSDGDVITPLYKYKIPVINITSGFSCDLDGRDMEYVTIDFNDYANEEYTYQYGIKRQAGVDYIKWYDISELSNYMYNFNEYYNGTIIYARVLDGQGNEIARNQYTINNAELPTFGLKITSGLACPIPNYDGDPQAEIINIDFSNAYDEDYKYYYYYDSRATKYEINVTSEQLTHQINEYLYNFIYFVIYDENDNLIYYAYGDVSTRLGFVPEDYETRHNIEISDGVACDLDGNKIINIKFNFSDITKYVNHYNFDVVINGEHFGSILYHEITLNEQNYIQDYDVKIYIDEFLYYSDSYRVGGILGEEGFEDTYNNMLNNGNWNEDLNVENVEDMGDLVIQFLGAISSFIATFFDLLDFFFQRLNFWIRACTITLFIELVICKIIKGVRK